MNISLASCHLSSFTSTKSHHFSSEKSIPWVGDKGLHSRGGSELLAEWVADRHGGLGGWTYDVCLLDALEFSMTDCFMDCGGGGGISTIQQLKKILFKVIYDFWRTNQLQSTNHKSSGWRCVYIQLLPSSLPPFVWGQGQWRDPSALGFLRVSTASTTFGASWRLKVGSVEPAGWFGGGFFGNPGNPKFTRVLWWGCLIHLLCFTMISYDHYDLLWFTVEIQS